MKFEKYLSGDWPPTVVHPSTVDIPIHLSLDVFSMGLSTICAKSLLLLTRYGSCSGVVVLASTNRPWDLDPALIRPGRIDALIRVSLPQKDARRQILRIHCDGVCMSHDVDFDELASSTELCSGAELRSLCQEAVLACEGRHASSVTMMDFSQALRSMCPASSVQDAMRYSTWGC
jgi:ATP-dependent 26S proteasome regulatory subunit